MLRLHGNVAGRTQIKDLGISLSYDEIKDIQEDDYRKSRDLQKAIAQGYVRAERLIEKRPKNAPPLPAQGYSDQISDLEAKVSALKDFMVQTQNQPKDETRLSLIEAKLDSLSGLLAQVVSKLQQPTHIIERVVEQGVKLPARPVKEETQEPFYIPQIRSEGISANIKADKESKSTSSVEEALKSLKDQSK